VRSYRDGQARPSLTHPAPAARRQRSLADRVADRFPV